MTKAPICPYCNCKSRLTDSAKVYGRSYGMIYICWPCSAWVGVHENSGNKPLGRLANAELREWKKKAHAAFDPRWRNEKPRSRARRDAYKWLAGKLGIDLNDCHIGEFDVDLCKRVVGVCSAPSPAPETTPVLSDALNRQMMRGVGRKPRSKYFTGDGLEPSEEEREYRWLVEGS